MLSRLQIIPVYIFSALFIAVNLYFSAKNMYFLSLLPLGIATLLFTFFAMDKLMLLVVFFTPLSIEIKELIPSLSFNLSLPTEPLLVSITFIFFIKLITEKRFDKKILSHPVSIVIYFYISWMLFTSITSTMPMVSFKYTISRIWFIVCFYFLTTQIVAKKSQIKTYIWAYASGLIIVVAITLARHAASGFDQQTANWICNPFYKDHTSYGAALAFILPGLVGAFRLSRRDSNITLLYFVALLFLATGLLFSYTRGAWIGIVAIIGVWTVVKLRFSLRDIFIILAVATMLIYPLLDTISFYMEKNDEVSSTNILSHVKSMSNVTTDASNLERINRWHCAIKMFEEKPIIGWGPGTYMFQYAPFQLAREKTIISTNAATLGNAHSDYLGLLSESGVLGPLSYIAVILTTMIFAFRVYHKSGNEDSSHIALFMILGLITYYIHGIINNFLDTDKISALFWGYTAIIVALDVYHSDKNKALKS